MASKRLALVCLFTVIGTVGCGNSPRTLKAIAITPATADAKDFPDGKVQFTAEGHFSSSPLSVKPLTVLWAPFSVSSPVATMDTNGLAQCISGATGTATVLAYGASDPSIPPSQLITAKRVALGTASLTCP
jgi:hypothetical protein